MLMRTLSVAVILLSLCSILLSGCSSPTGCFARTEERTVNLGRSVQNICLDGDGVN